MLRCIEEHEVPTFGTIPVGSLWADDSPFVVDVAKFEPVADEVVAPVVKKKARKFGQPVGESGPETVILPADAVIIPADGEA